MNPDNEAFYQKLRQYPDMSAWMDLWPQDRVEDWVIYVRLCVADLELENVYLLSDDFTTQDAIAIVTDLQHLNSRRSENGEPIFAPRTYTQSPVLDLWSDTSS